MSTTSATSYFVGPDSSPDKYRLRRMVGSGGEAQLWQAELVAAGNAEPVALKVLLPERGGDFARLSARWSEQAELLRFVRHPGVVGVREHFEGAPMHGLDAGSPSQERQLYLVMNWVEGVSLRDLAVLNGGPAATLEALQYLDQLAQVLDLLHSGRATPGGRPLVHGDLSPGNVMINRDGQTVLVDFGLIRAARHHTVGPMGTLGFAAPETWNAGEYSPASDRYGFGALAYFALTGTTPLGSPEQLRAGLMSNPLLAGRNPADIGHLLTIFSSDPAQRPPSALQWVRFLRNTATTTLPPVSGSVLPSRAPGPPPSTTPPQAFGAGSAGYTPTFTPQRQVAPPPTERGRSRAWLAAAAAGVVVVAGVVTAVNLGSGAGTNGTPAPDPGPIATVAAPTSRSASPTTAEPPTETFSPSPASFSPRYAPTKLVVALGHCGGSPNVDLAVPRTSSTGFADFNFASCSAPPSIEFRTGDIDGALLPKGLTPAAETCNAVIETSLLGSGEIPVGDSGGQVLCLRRTQSAVENSALPRVISAIEVTAVNDGSIDVTAYSWDINE